MGLRNSKDWNRFLLRFFVAFGFWEVISVPLRTLLFSVFYYDPLFRSFFVPITEIFWIGPIAADLIQVFFVGLLITFARAALPIGILGGILAGFVFSVAAFVAPILSILHLTRAVPTQIAWLWVFYQSVLILIASLIYSYSSEEEETY
ncbi:hypothetical protein LEP1GSC058_3578 [Leptospira fainei serovar Hurstbridge str. BUT 6]|uniref:Uncharacterized protein n=1 Tax=Leptospira fainei serovar Hurstbridge str. BUT 6 TaxID=1193011 RepID=S3VCV2_9LEPT|nr:hypothetical protein [Leptospira fainei]EPG74325.1 hypothetical protein LEP1GSC058_3578 [Leptospira fainei serovar Hurstbridge str. BUT 6]